MTKKSISEGIIEFPLSDEGITAGNKYSIQVVYDNEDSKRFASSTLIKEITILQIKDTSVSASIDDVVYGTASVLNGTSTGIPSGATVNIVHSSSDKVFTTTVGDDGSFTYSFNKNLSVGEYTVTVSYDGDSTHKECSTSCTYHVNKQALTLSNLNIPSNMIVSGIYTISCNITRANGSDYAVNPVLMDTNGNTLKSLTYSDSTGLFSCTYKPTDEGTLSLYVYDAGNDNYASVTSSTITVNITKNNTSINATDINTLYGESATLTGTSTGIPEGATVTITPYRGTTAGSSKTTTINSDGSFTYDLGSTMTVGSYTVHVDYSGDSTYDACSTTCTWTVNSNQYVLSDVNIPTDMTVGSEYTITGIVSNAVGNYQSAPVGLYDNNGTYLANDLSLSSDGSFSIKYTPSTAGTLGLYLKIYNNGSGYLGTQSDTVSVTVNKISTTVTGTIPSSMVVGTEYSIPVSLKDSNGNIISGVTVGLYSSTDTVNPLSTGTTDDNGTCTLSYTPTTSGEFEYYLYTSGTSNYESTQTSNTSVTITETSINPDWYNSTLWSNSPTITNTTITPTKGKDTDFTQYNISQLQKIQFTYNTSSGGFCMGLRNTSNGKWIGIHANSSKFVFNTETGISWDNLNGSITSNAILTDGNDHIFTIILNTDENRLYFQFPVVVDDVEQVNKIYFDVSGIDMTGYYFSFEQNTTSSIIIKDITNNFTETSEDITEETSEYITLSTSSGQDTTNWKSTHVTTPVQASTIDDNECIQCLTGDNAGSDTYYNYALDPAGDYVIKTSIYINNTSTYEIGLATLTDSYNTSNYGRNYVLKQTSLPTNQWLDITYTIKDGILTTSYGSTTSTTDISNVTEDMYLLYNMCNNQNDLYVGSVTINSKAIIVAQTLGNSITNWINKGQTAETGIITTTYDNKECVRPTGKDWTPLYYTYPTPTMEHYSITLQLYQANGWGYNALEIMELDGTTTSDMSPNVQYRHEGGSGGGGQWYDYTNNKQLLDNATVPVGSWFEMTITALNGEITVEYDNKKLTYTTTSNYMTIVFDTWSNRAGWACCEYTIRKLS